MLGLSISKAPLQASTVVVMGEIGEPLEDAEQVLVPEAAHDLHIAARHCELNGPTLVSLSPLSSPALRWSLPRGVLS
jgi:hypothetical protein